MGNNYLHSDKFKVVDENLDLYLYNFSENPKVSKWRFCNSKMEFLFPNEEKHYYTSALISVNTHPALVTVNRYAANNSGYERGIICVRKEGEKYIPEEILKISTRVYDYIDGVDSGFVRVKMQETGKWEILKLKSSEKGLEFEQFTDQEYDSVWNFYEKSLQWVTAEQNGKKVRIVFNEKVQENKGTVNTVKNIPETHKIDSISLSNYKRFRGNVEFDLSKPITFIVGQNNAGKSTFLSAIEIWNSNSSFFELKRRRRYDVPEIDAIGLFFRFEEDATTLDCINLFMKYHNRNTKEPLSMKICLGNSKLEILIDNHAEVQKVKLQNDGLNQSITFEKDSVTLIGFGSKETPKILKMSDWSLIDKGFSSHDEFTKLSGLDVLLNPLVNQNKQKIAGLEEFRRICDYDLMCFHGIEHIPVFAPACDDSIRILGDEVDLPESYRFIVDTISTYYTINSDHLKEYKNFVNKWLDRMNIGSELKIWHKYDSYVLKVTQKNGTEENLSHLGSGSIHFVILCLSMIIFIEKFYKESFVPTLLIEEPEQNLHPMLQSHLANFLLDAENLFHSLSANKELKMIVETHSEYLIKRSQILVRRISENNKPNPFRTYYFPSDGKAPYDMEYERSGFFKKEFGRGFADESSILAFQLF